MRRLLRIASARWWVFVLVGLLGLGAGATTAQLWNNSIEPSFEAQATYPVQTSNSGQRVEQSQQALRAGVERAVEVNSDLLALGDRSVSSDQEASLIVFSARGADSESASERAEELRTNFVVAELGAVDIDDRMELILDEAIQVSLALEALEPSAPVAPSVEINPVVQARIDFLLIQVDALTGESAKLVGNLVLAETGETRNGSVEEIQSQIDSTKEKLEDIYAELAAIPEFDPSMLEQDRTSQQGQPSRETASQNGTGQQDGGSTGSQRTEVSIPEDPTDIGPQWQGGALEDRYAQLQADYEALFMASLAGDIDPLDPVTVEDTTPGIITMRYGAAGGFGAGVLLAILALFLLQKTRKPLWVSSDLAPVPVFGEIPSYIGNPSGRPGRQRFEQRRRAIQQMRGSLIGVLESTSSPMAIGMVSIGVHPADTRELIGELATGLVAADRNVLLIDVDFRPATGSNEPVSGPTLGTILALSRMDPEAARSELKHVLTESAPEASGVRLLPAGTVDPLDPTDMLFGRSFGQILADSLSQVDVILIAVPQSDRATTADALFQRLDGLVAICKSRTTRKRDLVELANQLVERRAELLGAVLVVGRRRPGLRLPSLFELRSGGPFGRRRSQSRKASRRASSGPKSGRGSRRREEVPDSPGPGSAEPGSLKTELVERVKAITPMRYRRRLARARVRTRVPTSGWRALPDFLVIGAQRSGTSSLYKYLGQHPSIVPSLRKETEFFSSRHAAGEAWYRAHFPFRTTMAGSSAGNGRHLTFEADPSYLLDPRAPLRASTLLPDAKLIVLLRDPTERAISHYYHNVRLGNEKASLEEALDLEQERLNGEIERLWEDPMYPAKVFQRYSYVTRGLYADQLERWFEFYPSSRIKIIHSQDLFMNTADSYRDLLEFLGVPEWEPPTFRNFSYSNGGPAKPHVDDSVRDRLVAFFAPHNQHLYQLTDRNFGW